MKYVSEFVNVNEFRVYKIGDDGMDYRYENGKWIPLDRRIDYRSGFGDSYLYDVISEDEAKEILGVHEL